MAVTCGNVNGHLRQVPLPQVNGRSYVPEGGLERVSQCNLPESGKSCRQNTVILVGGLTGTTRALVAGDAYRATRPHDSLF